jgi:glucose/arabinose dehydrogenase
MLTLYKITRCVLFYVLCSTFILACSSYSGDAAQIIPKLDLPEGFEVQVYAENVTGARSMALSPNGVLYVGTRGEGKVYALVDENGDYKADRMITIAEDLRMPNGVAWRDGSLYVAEVSRILRFDDIDARLDNPPAPVVIRDDYPTEGHHGWKHIAFGPDGKLYVPVGAPCNTCESEDELYASITRINPDGSDREIVAHGVRNSVGFDWHPETGDLWFTDNGRDMMGDNLPPCELNHLTEAGQHFGYPYLHGNDIWDPEFGKKGKTMNSAFIPPAQELGPHVAPLGLLFYTGDMFPEDYKNQAFIAEHGSWNRSEKIGYRITLVRLEDGKAVSYTPFLTGWLQDNDAVWGRPVDLLQLEDGSVLVSDDHGGVIYRIVYTG